MIWQCINARLALLELLVRGSIKRRQAQVTAWEFLAELRWTKRTGRRDELGLVPSHRHDLVALLDRVWPEWSAGLAELISRGLPPTPQGWAILEDAQRAGGLPIQTGQMNRRTAAALTAPHSKASLTERRLAALGDIVATHDGSVRIRPPQGLKVKSSQGVIDLSSIAAVLGEVALPERFLHGGITFEGNIQAALLIENLGPFCDLPILDGWLFAHVPGWNTTAITQLLKRLEQLPTFHFGDLDPNGLRIFQHLHAQHPTLCWFVPTFWEEYIETRGLPGIWPDNLDLSGAPGIVQLLAHRDLWLEQEPLAIDPRTSAALAACL